MNRGAVELHQGLVSSGIDLVTSVPCISLKDLLELISNDDRIKHIPVTREEEGVGICAGAYLGGMRPAILMQNSGLGNMINALASLDLLYGFPLLMIASHRGVEGEQMIGQVPMGQLTEPLLRTIGIEIFVPESSTVQNDVKEAWEHAVRDSKPVALLLKPSFWR